MINYFFSFSIVGSSGPNWGIYYKLVHELNHDTRRGEDEWDNTGPKFPWPEILTLIKRVDSGQHPVTKQNLWWILEPY